MGTNVNKLTEVSDRWVPMSINHRIVREMGTNVNKNTEVLERWVPMSINYRSVRETDTNVNKLQKCQRDGYQCK
jgi:hypothetical protein